MITVKGFSLEDRLARLGIEFYQTATGSWVVSDSMCAGTGATLDEAYSNFVRNLGSDAGLTPEETRQATDGSLWAWKGGGL